MATVLTFEAFQFSRVRFCKFSKLFFFHLLHKTSCCIQHNKKTWFFSPQYVEQYCWVCTIEWSTESNHFFSVNRTKFCFGGTENTKTSGTPWGFVESKFGCNMFCFTQFSRLSYSLVVSISVVEAFENLHHKKFWENQKFVFFYPPPVKSCHWRQNEQNWFFLLNLSTNLSKFLTPI